MEHQIVKIYDSHEFKKVTKGIKIASCMRVTDAPKIDILVNNLDDLVISDSLCCSFCNTVFENKVQQRLHYKLDWHRFNLKQQLHGFKPISENDFKFLPKKNVISSRSGSDVDSNDEDSNYKCLELKSESGDVKCIDRSLEDNNDSLSIAARHSKVFFENDDGNIFSIYRCLLHNKKEIPEVENELITQALASGDKLLWTVIMVGGGHFAAAVFSEGKPLIHKTIHSYTTRAKQGSMQYSKDNRNALNHPKSAGASLRRYNTISLIQHVQVILESWTSHITNSSLIFYRAVGPYNRAVLFGGKNGVIDKNDSRLRPLPFPTRKATFNEVKRVHDILSNIEIYGSADNFKNCFPNSPRQPVRKKILKPSPEIKQLDNINYENSNTSDTNYCSSYSKKRKDKICDKQIKKSPMHIDRAKPRRIPERPLPDIVAKLASLSSSESEYENSDDIEDIIDTSFFIEELSQINFEPHLKSFENTMPNHKNKKRFQHRRKIGRY